MQEAWQRRQPSEDEAGENQGEEPAEGNQAEAEGEVQRGGDPEAMQEE